ncbi:DciA family protein [Streptantibioticus ferralitis]|uniref:DciA family protein n=1 Tax=Streptantibioticus ferralitis TaxID=236510 RepID=A0ABT5Z7E3_9ACTN|nr:DciA family protein [Streptantibioticus ferralitis]MDF2259745.1 DciA family protein [Streptantibioticus ferralitis]
MNSGLSGVDLARQALVAAREAAKKNGSRRQEKPKRSRTQVVRHGGREPLGLGTEITMMMTERGMVAPAAGGSVLARWDDVLAAAAPELAGHARAVAFDSDTGRLDVVPDAPAYGTKLRWGAPKLIATANTKAPGANVRTLHVLPPAPQKAGTAPAAADPDPQPTGPAGPVRTRENASDGYRRALAAHREAPPPRRVDPAIAQAVERQTAAMRELSRRAFPEPETAVTNAPAPIEAIRAQRRRQAAATEAAALQRARAERAAREAGTAAAVPQSAVLRTTA